MLHKTLICVFSIVSLAGVGQDNGQSDSVTKTTTEKVQDSLKPFVVKSRIDRTSTVSDIPVGSAHQLAELTQTLPGLSLQRTGSNTSKPVSHGVTGLRLQVMQEGMRIYGQPWGQDHAPEVGIYGAADIKVIRGVDIFRKSSSALGGLIDLGYRFIDTSKIGGKTSIYGGSNPLGGGATEQLAGRISNVDGLYYSVTGGGAYHGSANAPKYVLNNTAFGSYNGRLAIGLRGDTTFWEVSLSRFYNLYGILEASHVEDSATFQQILATGRPEHIEEFSWDIEGPSGEVTHDAFRFLYRRLVGKQGLITFDINMQSDLRREWEGHEVHPDSLDDGKPAHEIALNAVGLDVGYKRYGRYMNWDVGANVTTIQNGFQYEPLLPEYDELRAGAFLKAGKDFVLGTNALSIEAILRGDVNNLEQVDSLWTHPESMLTRQGLSGGVQLHYEKGTAWNYLLFMGRFWRPAAANELFSQGTHFGAASVEVGEINLSDESGSKAQLDIQFHRDKWRVSVSGYGSYFDNFIYLRPKGVINTDEGSFQSYRYFNSEAWIAGSDLRISWESPSLIVNAGAGWSMGEDLDQSIPIWNVPAANYRVSLGYKRKAGARGNVRLSTGVHGELRKQKWPESFVLTPPPESYVLWDASIQYTYNRKLSVNVGVKNILDTEWRSYLDRLRYFAAMPGRNVIMALSYHF